MGKNRKIQQTKMVIKRKIQQTEMIKIENFQVKDGKNRKYGRQNGKNKNLQKTKIVKFEEKKLFNQENAMPPNCKIQMKKIKVDHENYASCQDSESFCPEPLSIPPPFT